MRASRCRSHHSSSPALGREAAPHARSPRPAARSSAASTVAGVGRPSDAASAAARDRPEAAEAARAPARAARPRASRLARRSRPAPRSAAAGRPSGCSACAQRQPLGGDPQRAVRCRAVEQRGAPGLRQRVAASPPQPALAAASASVTKPSDSQRLVHLVGVARLAARPRRARAAIAVGVEPAEVVGALRVEPAAAQHRLRAALLERRVVEEGVGRARSAPRRRAARAR